MDSTVVMEALQGSEKAAGVPGAGAEDTEASSANAKCLGEAGPL